MSRLRRLAKTVDWFRRKSKRCLHGLENSPRPRSVCRFASRKCDRPAPDDIATIIGLIEHLEQHKPDGFSLPHLPTQP